MHSHNSDERKLFTEENAGIAFANQCTCSLCQLLPLSSRRTFKLEYRKYCMVFYFNSTRKVTCVFWWRPQLLQWITMCEWVQTFVTWVHALARVRIHEYALHICTSMYVQFCCWFGEKVLENDGSLEFNVSWNHSVTLRWERTSSEWQNNSIWKILSILDTESSLRKCEK